MSFRTLALGAIAAVLGALAWAGANETALADAPAFTARPISASASTAVETRTWESVRADATRLLGRRVKFAVQFHGRVDRWQSYLSRFSSRTHSAYQFWSDEQMPFRADEHDAPMARVFVRRGSGVDEVLSRATRYGRFEIEGTVQELFLGEAWIEAETVNVLHEALTEGSVIHGGRALVLMDEGLWSLAESQLSSALQATLHSAARDELERLRQICRANLPASSRGASRPWSGPAPNVRIPNRGRSGGSD